MLRLIGSHYHFRRTVPVVLQSLLGQTETSFPCTLKAGF